MSQQKLSGKVLVVAREELSDAERVNEAIDGAFWRAIERKVKQMIEQHQAALETLADDRELARAQGAAKALRRVLELPEIIRRERGNAAQ